MEIKPLEDQIYEILLQEKYCSCQFIANKLNLPRTTLYYHISILLKRKRIAKFQNPKKELMHPPETLYYVANPNQIIPLFDDLDLEIFNMILQGECSRDFLVAQLHRPRTTIFDHIGRLIKYKKIGKRTQRVPQRLGHPLIYFYAITQTLL